MEWIHAGALNDWYTWYRGYGHDPSWWNGWKRNALMWHGQQAEHHVIHSDETTRGAATGSDPPGRAYSAALLPDGAMENQRSQPVAAVGDARDPIAIPPHPQTSWTIGASPRCGRRGSPARTRGCSASGASYKDWANAVALGSPARRNQLPNSMIGRRRMSRRPGSAATIVSGLRAADVQGDRGWPSVQSTLEASPSSTRRATAASASLSLCDGSTTKAWRATLYECKSIVEP